MAAELREEPEMAEMPDIKRYLYHADGTAVREGETLKNPELAVTLRTIARDGAKAFYSGPIAAAIVDKVQHAPVNHGGMTLADLARYKPVERAPVCGNYRTYRLCSMGPPSSGGVAVLQILGMLQRFPSSQLQPDTLSEVHLVSEAERLAFADRAQYLGDPDAIHVPVAGLLDKSLSGAAGLADRSEERHGAGASRHAAGRRHAALAAANARSFPAPAISRWWTIPATWCR